MEEKIKSGWHASLAEGLNVALLEQKPVLIDMWATWCKNCVVMDRTTLADPAVTKALDGYVKIKYQAEQLDEYPARALVERFKVIGLPTYVILHPNRAPISAPPNNAAAASADSVYVPETSPIRFGNRCVVQVTPMSHSDHSLTWIDWAPPRTDCDRRRSRRWRLALRHRTRRCCDCCRCFGTADQSPPRNTRKFARWLNLPQTPAASQVGALEKRVAEQEKTVAAIKAQTDGNPPPVVSRALAGKWYERIGLRGYTQFRVSNVIDHEGPPLEVPNDRSVNENETFIIRRGRFVFSGDITDRLSLYAQSDFNGSTGAADFSLQMRDLYADVWLDKAKFFRVRAGQSKVPFGWVNMQSSQNRAPMERPDGINSAVEGERDYGATFMWTPATAKQVFRDITARGLKGTGDYGLVAVGLYAGQGPNRSDLNGQTHVVGRVAYPFKLASGQFVEVGVQGYHGRFVTPLQAIPLGGGASITPMQDPNGALDQRIGFTAIWYPQPIGVETEWNFGRGPELSPDNTRIISESLHGGYVQINYRQQHLVRDVVPVRPVELLRWRAQIRQKRSSDQGERSRHRPRVREMGRGRVQRHVYAHVPPHADGRLPVRPTLDANRVGVQLQWNY